jgi:hypothetical protein
MYSLFGCMVRHLHGHDYIGLLSLGHDHVRFLSDRLKDAMSENLKCYSVS